MDSLTEPEQLPLGTNTIVLSPNIHVKCLILIIILCGNYYRPRFLDEEIECREVIKFAEDFTEGSRELVSESGLSESKANFFPWAMEC